ncbi:MAG: hypothetical protein D6830_07300 [Ignavibacteria bacterium]|nr:MAG: hypothetical protein D6830_07300 [Ignavibacteria bacterium]
MKKFVLLSLLLLTPMALSSQTVIAKYGGEFLSLGVGGRALGMGGAYLAVANDVTAGYWNPAGLARLNYPQISLMHEEHFGNLVNYNYGGVAIPYGNDMSFGFSLIRLSVDGIPDTREALVDKTTGQVIYDITNPNGRIDPDKVKEFSNTDYAFYLSFAKRQTSRFFWGANVKIIKRDIADVSAMGIGFDVGAFYNPFDKLYLAANLTDATTTLVAWSESGRNELISPTLKLGAAYGVSILGLEILPALDADIRFENRRFASTFNLGPVSFDLKTGIELSYKNIVSVRGGYSDVKQFTVGAGVKLPKLNIDYSFAQFSGNQDETLPVSHRISVMLTLEEPRFLRKSN